MSFDSLILRSVITQLNKTIIDGEILGVIQSSPYEFTLRISACENMYNLLFSIHPVYARTHITGTYPKKEKRWHFADFLQTHIGKGRISVVEQVDFDRIIRINVIPRGDIIDPSPKVLIGEFMGKHSNVILLEKNRILESMKHIDESMSRYRQVLPGETYIAPPANQTVDLFSVDEETLSAIFASDDSPLWKKLLKNFQGISPLLAKEISARVTDTSLQSIISVLSEIKDNILNERYSPNVLINDQNDVIAVSAINLDQFDVAVRRLYFPTISDALEHFYGRLIAKETLTAEKNAMLQAVKRKYQYLQEKQDLLNQRLEVAKDADSMKMKGDLLIANLNRIRRGQKEVTLSNPYDPDSVEVTIQLDEKLSPSDNAQRYFERYKKAKKSKDILAEFISRNEAMLGYLERTIEEIGDLEDVDTLANVRNELMQKGIIKEKTTSVRKQKAQLFRRFRSSDEFQIYVGRNDKENDLLIREESSKNDMWLHAKQIEGSHVIIRNPEKKPEIPKRTLLEAAIIAANFSKAKHSSVVPVDYTWVKYVTKPRGAKPGFVIYTHEKTLFVSPSDFNKLLVSTEDRRE